MSKLKNSMRYLAKIWASGSFPVIKIDEKKFNSLKAARNVLSGALAIEEKYELLLSNYLELEKEALSFATEYMVRNTNSYYGFFDVRLAFNRRIVNLLTSTKLYIDQIEQHVKTCIPEDTNTANKIKSYFSDVYDSCFEYRFMEALRNYIQHRGLAVHSTSWGKKWTSLKGDAQLEFHISLYTHKSEVENDKAFKRSVFNEMPEKVELSYSIRTYIGFLNNIHCEIRKLVSENTEKARILILNFIDEYKKLNGGDSIGLTAVCSIPKEPIDETVEKFPLLLDWDDIRLELIKKNNIIENLGKRYVTGNAYNPRLGPTASSNRS